VHGGGGHRRAAGFGTDLEFEQVVEFLIGEIESQI
jgi:nanoRNase/pAp phosphatase (c-di-AMP/oligoRNAs hydrolase)